MSLTCKFCETQKSVIEKQTKADEDVANGKMPEGQYLKLCEITKNLYNNLMVLCECKSDESEDEEILVTAISVTRNNIIDLVGLPGAFIDNYINREVFVAEELIDGNKRLVYPSNLSGPFTHIYYDDNDNQFKQEIDFAVGH